MERWELTEERDEGAFAEGMSRRSVESNSRKLWREVCNVTCLWRICKYILHRTREHKRRDRMYVPELSNTSTQPITSEEAICRKSMWTTLSRLSSIQIPRSFTPRNEGQREIGRRSRSPTNVTVQPLSSRRSTWLGPWGVITNTEKRTD